MDDIDKQISDGERYLAALKEKKKQGVQHDPEEALADAVMNGGKSLVGDTAAQAAVASKIRAALREAGIR